MEFNPEVGPESFEGRHSPEIYTPQCLDQEHTADPSSVELDLERSQQGRLECSMGDCAFKLFLIENGVIADGNCILSPRKALEDYLRDM